MHSDLDDKIITPQWRALGVERLLSAPRDLALCGVPIVSGSEERPGTPQHATLFEEYVADLRSVIPEARRVWLAIIEQTQKAVPQRDKAMVQALHFQPAGAAFDGRIVWVVRKYWLACDRINRELPEQERIAPEVFLLKWLIVNGHDDAVDVLAGMPYWPIGLDAAGNWV